MDQLLSDAQLDALRQIDTPTIANAIEPFNIRSNTDGFMGYDIRCLYPEMGAERPSNDMVLNHGISISEVKGSPDGELAYPKRISFHNRRPNKKDYWR